MATIDIYDKGQTDALLATKADAADLPSASELVPDYSGASADDVLTIENGAPVWKAAGASSGNAEIIEYSPSSKVDAYNWLTANLQEGDQILMIHTGTYQTGAFFFQPAYYMIGATGNITMSGFGMYGTSAQDEKILIGRIIVQKVSDTSVNWRLFVVRTQSGTNPVNTERSGNELNGGEFTADHSSVIRILRKITPRFYRDLPTCE